MDILKNILRETCKFVEPHCNTERYWNLPLVYLTKMLNNYYTTVENKNKLPHFIYKMEGGTFAGYHKGK